MEAREPAAIDGRELRAAQGVVAVLLLGGFVFGQWLLVPLAGIFGALGGFVGPHAHPVHAVYRAVLARHLDPTRVWEAPSAVRALDLLTAALCGVATLAFLAGISLIGWLLALGAASIAAVAATTGINAAVMLRERFHR